MSRHNKNHKNPIYKIRLFFDLRIIIFEFGMMVSRMSHVTTLVKYLLKLQQQHKEINQIEIKNAN